MSTAAGKTEFPVSVALGGGRRQEVRIGRHTTWEQFRQRVHQAFGLPAGAVTYIDEEGDKIALDSEEEFKEAVKVGLKLGKLKLNISDTKARPPRTTNPQAAKGHYSNLSRTVGEAKKTKAAGGLGAASTDSPIQSKPNPYIAEFVRSMSREEPSEDTSGPAPTANSGEKQASPYVESPVKPSSEGAEGAAVKRRRVNVSGMPKGYRRAYRPTKTPVHVEGVRQDLEAMKISPGAYWNPYVEKIAIKLQQQQGQCTFVSPWSSKCTKTRFHNQYIVDFHQRLLKTHRVRQASRPNRYVSQLHHRLNTATSGPTATATGNQSSDHQVNMECSPAACLPASTGPMHCGVKCDGCERAIVGVRYKCGNCSDYDLCEQCEPRADLLHSPDHVFLKVKVPCFWLGRDPSGFMRPLLPYTVYSCQELSEDQVPLLRSESGGVPMIVRPKEKLREDIKAAKKRRKEEKSHFKEEKNRCKDTSLDPHKLKAKLEKLQTKKDHSGKAEFVLPPVAFEGPKVALSTYTHHHGHKKYLSCKVVTDTCCPQGSSIPPGVDFEKGWILKNSGTKKWKHTELVHQGGYRPCKAEVAIPEVRPGESVEVRVQYPAVDAGEDIQIIESSWNLIHKESTAFGPTLTVSIIVETESPPTLPPSSTTNEDLLKSIGFLPTENKECQTSTPPVCVPSYPTAFDVAHNNGEPEQFPSSNPQEGATTSDQFFPAFVMVENPRSAVMSLSSTDSLHQTAPVDSDGEMETESVASDVSGSDDEFVVVIPDCFNFDLPLSAHTSHDVMTRSCDEFEYMAGSHDQFTMTDDIMTRSHDSTVVHEPTPSEPVTDQVPPPPEDSVPCPKPEPQTPPTWEPKTTATGTSPQMRRRAFVPERVTLRGVKDARLTNPLTVATGLVNTVAHLVEGLVIPGKKKSTERDGREVKREEPEVSKGGQQQQELEEEEAFVDCPQFPEPSAPPLAPPLAPPAYTESSPPPSYTWKQCLPDVASWLQRDVTQFVRSDSQNDVSELMQREWSAPNPPDDPVEKLVAMGFGNRELNRELLQKHDHQLQAVTNELLDRQNGGDNHWASTRH